MTLTEKTKEYARQHLQAVRVCWINRRTTEHDAVVAAELCSDYHVSGQIVGVVAQDKTLEDMLNKLLDCE